MATKKRERIRMIAAVVILLGIGFSAGYLFVDKTEHELVQTTDAAGEVIWTCAMHP